MKFSHCQGNENAFFAILLRYIDVSLLKDAMFIGMCLSVVLMSVGCPYMLYFLPAYALSAGECFLQIFIYFNFFSLLKTFTIQFGPFNLNMNSKIQ